MSKVEIDPTRRVFLRNCLQGAVLLITHPLLGVVYAIPLHPTPSNTEGPFYKEGAPFRTNLVEPTDQGIPLSVSGKVVDTQGAGISGAVVDVWHTDPDGNYDLNGYKHRARVAASSNAEYHFNTVVPGAYGSRPQHIHYRITGPGHRTLITQLYFESDPFFEGNVDQNLRKDSIVMHRELIKPVAIKTNNRTPTHEVIFQICLEKA